MADNTGSDQKQKWFHLTQIRDLESLELEYAKLEKENKDLTSLVTMLKKDKKDTIEQLKIPLAAEEKKAEELESQLKAMHQHRKDLKLQQSQQMQKLQEQFDELKSVNIMKEAQLEKQKEQLKQMMQQLSDQESLEKQLINEKQEHEAAMFQLKIEEELERKRLIEQMYLSVDDRAKMRASVILQSERAQLKENLQRNQFLVTENITLEKEVGALQDRVNDLSIKRNTLKKDISKTNRENLTYEKELEQMKQRCQQLEVELHDCRVINKNMLDKEKNLRGVLALKSKKRHQNAAEINQLTAEIQKKTSRCQELEGVMQEAVIILKHDLTENPSESDSQWMMERLLDIMESTAPSMVSTCNVSKEKSGGGPKLKTTDPKPARKKPFQRFRAETLWQGNVRNELRPMWRPAIPTSVLPPISRAAGVLEPVPADIEQEALNTLDRLPLLKNKM